MVRETWAILLRPTWCPGPLAQDPSVPKHAQNPGSKGAQDPGGPEGCSGPK